jgi:hypothetical protein
MSCFFPGQRVICIDGKFHPSVWEYVNDVPIEGEIYTVRSVRLGGRDNVTGKIGPAICLKEISGRLPGVNSEVAWIVRRFAPVDLQDSTSATRKKKSRPKRKAAPAPQPVPAAN